MSNPANHLTRWTASDQAALDARWDGHQATAESLAADLGRTPNAVLSRFYEIASGRRSGSVADLRSLEIAPVSHADRSPVAQALRPYLGLADESGDRWWDQNWSAR